MEVKIIGCVKSQLSKNFNSWQTVQIVSQKEFPNSTQYYSTYVGRISGDNLFSIPMNRDIEFTCKVKDKYLNCVSWVPVKLQDNRHLRKFLENVLYDQHRLITKTAIADLVKDYGDHVVELFENKETSKLMPYFSNAYNVVEACRIVSKLDANDSFFRFMAEHNIPRSKAMKIWEEFQDDALNVITQNPFICMEIDGIGFKTCDEIAKSLNTALDSYERIIAGTKFMISYLTESKGDIAVELQRVMEETVRLLNLGIGQVVTQQKWLEVIKKEMNETLSSFVIYDKTIMLKHDSENERKTSLRICNMLNYGNGMPSAYDYAQRINESRKMKLVASQMEAVKVCLSSPVSVLTGGPGTGKTTVVKTIVEAYKASCSMPVTCMAPTGKAASRMSEATGEEAHTIHKTLNIIPGLERDNAVVLPRGLIIVDELSMIDQETMSKLMDAVPTKAQIIFVGDINQLPSVGKGDVLNQLISSGVVPVARLTETFRQKKGSLIVDNAYKVNEGQTDLQFDKETFELYRLTDTETDMERFKKFYAFKVEQYGVENVMVLCPRRRKAEDKKLFFVSDVLNTMLQDVANPPSEDKAEAKVKVANGEIKFRVGDRVMQWKNKKDSSNGDIGVLKNISVVDNEVIFGIEWEVDGSKSLYNFEDMETITLAYAMSIHKSQGSEAQCVIMPFMKEHSSPLFQRNLLYTGITRAKTECIIVGDKESVDTCIKKEVTGTRVSYLSKRLQMRNSEY